MTLHFPQLTELNHYLVFFEFLDETQIPLKFRKYSIHNGGLS